MQFSSLGPSVAKGNILNILWWYILDHIMCGDMPFPLSTWRCLRTNFSWNGTTRFERKGPDLITQHQCPTSQMLLWMNGSKSLQPGSKNLWKALPEQWRLLCSAIWTSMVLNSRYKNQTGFIVHMSTWFCHGSYIWVARCRNMRTLVQLESNFLPSSFQFK